MSGGEEAGEGRKEERPIVLIDFLLPSFPPSSSSSVTSNATIIDGQALNFTLSPLGRGSLRPKAEAG
jgi:hypothetical protein